MPHSRTNDSAEASEQRANRPSESRSSDEPISVVGIGASAGGLESEMRFREFAENSADVFWIIDAANEKLEYLNRAYEHIWGEARGAVMRDLERWKQLLHPDDRARVGDNLRQLLNGRRVTVEYRIVRPNDGEVRWIRDSGFPIYDEKGVLTRVAGVGRDITPEKERQEALLVTQQRFRLLVEGAPEYAMFIIGLDNRITYWSAGAERIFGWSAEEAVGQPGTLIFTPEDLASGQEIKEIEIAARDGVASDRRWHMRKDGSRVWVDGVMRRLVEENGALRGFAKIARDATERREAEEKLKQSHVDLERRVAKRTADLTAANQKLQEEIKQRVKLEQEILQISEREQRRIGQDLHDSLCQELAAAAFFLRSTAKKLGPKRRAGIRRADRGCTDRECQRWPGPGSRSRFAPCRVERLRSTGRAGRTCLSHRSERALPISLSAPRAGTGRDISLKSLPHRAGSRGQCGAARKAKGNHDFAHPRSPRHHPRYSRQRQGHVCYNRARGPGYPHHEIPSQCDRWKSHVDSKPNDGTTITCHVPSR